MTLVCDPNTFLPLKGYIYIYIYMYIKYIHNSLWSYCNQIKEYFKTYFIKHIHCMYKSLTLGI